MRIFSEEIEHYAKDHTNPESAVLKEINRETHIKMLHSRMLAGHMQGKLLQMISWMIRPKNVLEIGTFTAYSAICLAEGLDEKGKVHTIDHNPEYQDIILDNIRKAGLTEKILFHCGKAINIINQIEGNFDLVYIDADKENYVSYYEMLLPRVEKNGFILADNVLWDGKVLPDVPETSDAETAGIIAFNEHIKKDNRIDNILLPFRDGLMLMRKL